MSLPLDAQNRLSVQTKEMARTAVMSQPQFTARMIALKFGLSADKEERWRQIICPCILRRQSDTCKTLWKDQMV